MNYYMVRWECDAGCGEVEDTEESLPLGWEEIDGEELCEACVKVAREKSGD